MVDQKLNLLSNVADLSKNASRISIVDEDVPDKYKESSSKEITPKFTVAEIASRLMVEEDTLKNVLRDLEENHFTQIERTSQKKGAHYRLTVEVAQAAAKLLERKSLAERRAAGEIIETKVTLIHTGKGGVGKSTSCTSLAAESSYDVLNSPTTLIIDGDYQGTLRHLSNLDISEESLSYTDLIKENINTPRDERRSEENQERYRDALKSMIISHKSERVDILPSLKLDKMFSVILTGEIMKADDAHARIQEVMTVFKDCVIEPLKGLYDFIFIDTNPDTNALTIMFMYACTHMIVPVTGRATDIEAYQDFWDALDIHIKTWMPDDFHHDLRIKSLITMHQTRTKSIDNNARSIEKHMDTFRTYIRLSKAYEDASEACLPIQKYDHKRGGTEALKALTALYQEYVDWVMEG